MSVADTSGPRKARDPLARQRLARGACDLCHVKKVRCEGSYPCSGCKKRGAICLWAGGAPVAVGGSHPPEYVKWLEEKVLVLSGSKKPDAVSRNPVTAATGLSRVPPPSSPSQHQPWQSTARFEVADEVTGVNRHTNDHEFYGSSSSVALLSRVGSSPSIQGARQGGGDELGDAEPDSLLTDLHNPVFTSWRADIGSRRDGRSAQPAFPQCKVFLNGFFGTLHYIHPILDKSAFMRRCETLWACNKPAEPTTFLALYYSVLSLGALVGPREDEPIDGQDNLTWSRRLFQECRSLCTALGMATDLEMVQCYFFLSKICQNELNPHLTYMYVGLAVRTALAIGINRRPSKTSKKDPAIIKAESRTWWGLYSLEMEMSFGMGRPDTLGADLYHNRLFPLTVIDGDDDHELLEPPYCAIIESMVTFSRITRRICLEIYAAEAKKPWDAAAALAVAVDIDRDITRWLEDLPAAVKPRRELNQEASLKTAKEPQYVKKQKLVLAIKYHNIRILLFGSFLLKAANREELVPSEDLCIQNCLESAKQTIDVIYDTYRHHEFFRTWFYNTTYTVFASTMILLYMSQVAKDTERPLLGRYVEKAIEILEVMDESVTATKSAEMIRRALARVPKPSSPAGPNMQLENDLWLPSHHYWGSVDLLDGHIDEDFPFYGELWESDNSMLV